MTSWQDVRDMGLGLFKKQNRSRTLWMGGSSTFLGILAYIILLAGVSVTTSGDIVCGEECVSYVNITSTYWRICFEDEFELVKTDPQGVDIDVYVPTYGSRWRLFDVTKDCIERKSKYNSLPNRFKIVGHKPKSLTVKWWSDAMHIPDPVWEGVFDTNVVIDLGNNQTDLSFAINYSKVDWSSIINITSGNWTWNMSEDDVVSYNTGAFTFNITNNDTTAPHNILMKIDRDANYYSLYCNNTYINVGWTKILTNLSSNGSVQINCTMDFNNISKRIVNFYDPIYLDNLTAYWRFGQSLSNETIDYIGSNNGVNNGYTFNNARLNDNTVRNETYGKYGKGFGFDGDGDYILVVNKTNQIFNITTGSRSYSSWIKPRGGPKNSVLITTASANNQGDYMSIRSNVGSQFNCVFLDGTNQHYKAYPIDLSWNDDTWYHLYCGYDGTTVVMCVNGICDSGEDGSSARTYNYRGLFIGTESDMDNQLNGSLDNICIINHSLTQTEVTALYSSGMYPNASTPCDVLYLSGETGNTTDAYDENNLVDGEWEQANRFDGVNDYIFAGEVSDFNFTTEQRTYSAWVNPIEIGTNMVMINADSTTEGDAFYLLATGEVHCAIHNGTYQKYLRWGSINWNKWNHITCSWNGTTIQSCINGVCNNGIDTDTLRGRDHDGLYIGSESDNNLNFNGSIDDVMIFNRSLTSAEINSLYYGYDRTQHNYNYEFKGE